jgi:hypothetical protein
VSEGDAGGTNDALFVLEPATADETTRERIRRWKRIVLGGESEVV